MTLDKPSKLNRFFKQKNILYPQHLNTVYFDQNFPIGAWVLNCYVVTKDGEGGVRKIKKNRNCRNETNL